MKGQRFGTLALTAIVALGGGVAWGQPAVPVGVAKVDITPDYPVRMHGYASRAEESKGVQLRLWAKALAIGSDEQGPVVLVAMDNLGTTDALSEELARRLREKANVARERLAVSASHTHSAPMIAGLAPNIFGKPIPPEHQAHIERYTKELLDKLEAVALAALADRKPALLSWGQGSVGFAMNRRVARGQGQVTFGENPQAPVDHALPVLRVAAPDGKTRAIVVNYACHCTTLDPADNVLSGDWAGYAQEAMEADHPGAIALTLVGCGGDANPANRTSVDVARGHGRALADEVKRLLAGALVPLDGPPTARFRRVAVPLDTLPTRAELEALVKAGSYAGYNAQTQLERLDRGEKLQEALDYPVQTWQFGDKLVMVFLAGEVVVDYALRLKRELDPARVWVTAYANDVPCYIASERILKEGGYEGGGAMVFYARPTRLKPGVEDIIISAVRAIVPPEFNAPKVEAKKAAAGLGLGVATTLATKLVRQDTEDVPAPLTPEEGTRAWRTKPEFKVELVAAEPLVIDPVAIDFGTDGKLYVCEMHDYPAGLKGNYEPGGRINVLEDTDGDGRYDKATRFLDGLPFPTGVMCWRKGVLICAAPNIWYAEDTDGDGKADVKKALFEGFATENYQARVNGLEYGLDNWVYGANGLIGGRIKGLISGREIDLGGRDFRIRPDTGVMGPASGLSQQGRVRDDWGNAFGCSNSVLLQNFPFPDDAAARNPFVAAPQPAVYVPRNADSSLLYPASRLLARFNHPESANRVTSACGVGIYRDELLGADYRGNAFICEPVHNLVTRQVLTPRSVTFAGRRASDEQTSEFLASTDNWCRPVQVRTGPDGALWVVDMYRYVIEHPRWISPDRLRTLPVRAGDDRGRIYRVVREGTRPRPAPALDGLRTPELARALDSPNGTRRDQVQRLLVHRGDESAVPVLAELAERSRHPEVRAQALCALDGLKRLNAAQLMTALDDPDPRVRRVAARLSGAHLKEEPALGARLVALVKDAALPVRYEAALSLGEWDADEAGQALGALAVSDRSEPWVRGAVLSSARNRPGVILKAVLGAVPAETATQRAWVGPLISTIAGAGKPEGIAAVVEIVASPETRGLDAVAKLAMLADLLDALDRAGPGKLSAVPAAALDRMTREARDLVANREAKPAARSIGARLLGRAPGAFDEDLTLLSSCLGPQEPAEVREAALGTLARLRDVRAATAIVGSWAGLGPALRGKALDALLSRPNWAMALLNEGLAAGAVAPSEIDASHRQQLLKNVDATVRERAAALLASAGLNNRQAVLESFATALEQRGDPSKGREVFAKVCATCHLFGGQGHAVGPDLEGLTDTTTEALSIAILDPNREVDARYASYAAGLTDGRVLTGLIASETGSAVTLKTQEGREDVLLRSQIEELRGTGQSLMPEGIEKDLTPGDLVDVIAYVASGGSPPKTFAGNHPETVHPGRNGVIRLEAETAAIRGESLVFEPELKNLGYWHSANDRATWSFVTDKPATYTVTMEWACEDASASQTYVIKTTDRVFEGTVGGTGTWADYRSIFLFEAKLPAGRHQLDIRPSGPLRSALLDLKAIVLTPRT